MSLKITELQSGKALRGGPQLVVESLAMAMWGELRSFCEPELQVKTMEAIHRFSHTVKWFFHVSAQSTAPKWHSTLRVRSYTDHCSSSAVHALKARIKPELLIVTNISANSSSRSTDQHLVAQSSMPWYVQELHHRQLKLLAAIEHYEQRARLRFKRIISMRPDFEFSPSGLASAWSRLHPTRCVHQWDYAFLLLRSEARLVLGFGHHIERCTRKDHEMCVSAHLRANKITPIFVFDMGQLRRGGGERRGRTPPDGAGARRRAHLRQAALTQ